MQEVIDRLTEKFCRLLNIGHVASKADKEEKELLELIKQAHKDWRIAMNNYNYCFEQDMIDYSIYNIEAMERKYMCLVKRARRETITIKLPVLELREDSGVEKWI